MTTLFAGPQSLQSMRRNGRPTSCQSPNDRALANSARLRRCTDIASWLLPPVVSACIALGGCAIPAAAPPEGGIPAGSQYGFVFGSIGSSGDDTDIKGRAVNFRRVSHGSDCATTNCAPANPSNVGYFAYGRGWNRVMGSVNTEPSDTSAEFTDGTIRGNVFRIRLPAGKYEVINAQFDIPDTSGRATLFPSGHATLFTPVPHISFEVEAGRATYLGEFLSKASHSLVVSDKLARDMGVLNKHELDIDGTNVINVSSRFAAF
jgi:hypothetical protein